jgi:short chain dehydrogenase
MAEDKLLAGRVAIVTGAASGMGRVMARALADAGAKIAGVDVDAAGLSRLAAEPVLTGKFLRTVTDVSKTAECRRAVQQVMETFGALDILINCAGVSMSTAAGHSEEARIKFFEADPEGWQRILAINTIGAFLMARFAAEPMIKQGWGRIIHVTTSFDTMRLRRFQSCTGGELRELRQGPRRHGGDREHPGPGRTDRDARFLSARQTAASHSARPRDHGGAGGMARLVPIRRHQRLPLHRTRLESEPGDGRGRGTGARAGCMARTRAGRECSPGTSDVVGMSA